MFAAARRILAVYIVFILTLVPGRMTEAVERSPLVSREPSITFVGGTPARRETVVAAVTRYIESGLSLPDLEVHIHEDRSGCRDMQGLFRPSGDIALIDLCYGGEFPRSTSLVTPGSTSISMRMIASTSSRSPVRRRGGRQTSCGVSTGAELTANTLAHGLLSTHLESAVQRALDFDRFETLTGLPSPRLAELEPQADTAPVMSETERIRLAASRGIARKPHAASLRATGPPARQMSSKENHESVSKVRSQRQLELHRRAPPSDRLGPTHVGGRRCRSPARIGVRI